MNKLDIGRVINTRGLKGELKIESHSSFTKERFRVGNIIYFSKDEANFIEKKILSFSFTKGFVYITVEGITSLDLANEYREYLVYCDDTNLLESKNVYHLTTLTSLKVIYKGEEIGKIVDIDSNGYQDLIRVEIDDKTILVPFLKEFIVKISKEEGIIELKNLEGLI